MDFRYTEDQLELIGAAKAVFEGENTLERLRRLVEQPELLHKQHNTLWPQFAELGLIGLIASESHGGLGQPLEVMVGVAEEAGYVGLPDPLIELAGIAVPLLEVSGQDKILADVVAGHTSVGVVSALQHYQANSHLHDMFIVTLKDDARVVAANDVPRSPRHSIDPLRDLVKLEVAATQHHTANWHGAVLTAAQLVGLSRRMVDMSVEYAKDRKQFGKPIGSFQAIKHHLATVYTQLEFTRPIIQLAAIKGGAAVHTAKLAAIEAATLAAETAIQVHGGMGYTYEVDLHLFMKRAWALSAEWGDRHHHLRALEHALIEESAELGASYTFA